MDSYIEVIGSADLVETVVEYGLELNLQVRATKIETALAEVGELRAQCIQQLRAGGLRSDELKEGGTELWRPWYLKKKVGQEASQKILIASDDIHRIFTAMAALESLFDHARYSLTVSMRRPKFDAGAERVQDTRRQAVSAAREKAAALAEQAGVRLGGVLQIEELERSVSRSGVYGDEDWRGGLYIASAGAVSEGESEPAESLDGATRVSTLRFRVRYAIG